MISSLKLAKLCGVSQGTVDRALHDRPGIGAATKQKVLAAAKKFGYRPNPTVGELLGRPSTAVGAIVPSLNGPFFMDLMTCVKEALAERGLRLFLCPVAERDEFLRTLADFAARRMRAAIVVPPEGNIRLPDALTREMPVLSLLSPCRGAHTAFAAPDEVKTGRQAVAYLVDRGHRRILHVTYERKAKAIVDRAKGYQLQMKSQGLGPCVLVWRDDPSVYDAIGNYGPTAVFCHNDWLALAVIRLLQSQGVSVPDAVSVLGVDNGPTFNSLFPDLTTLAYPMADLAGQAGQWLSNPRYSFRFKPMTLMERKTVRNCPDNPPVISMR